MLISTSLFMKKLKSDFIHMPIKNNPDFVVIFTITILFFLTAPQFSRKYVPEFNFQFPGI